MRNPHQDKEPATLYPEANPRTCRAENDSPMVIYWSSHDGPWAPIEVTGAKGGVGFTLPVDEDRVCGLFLASKACPWEEHQ